MKLLYYFFVGVVMLMGCSSCEDNEIISFSEQPKTSNVKREIILNYISRVHSTDTRSAEIFLSPYIVDKDTVFYVVNYPEGGFEIFSNNFSLPMVVVKAKNGYFDPNMLTMTPNPFNTFIDEIAHGISGVGMDEAKEEMNYSWSRFALTSQEKNSSDHYVGIACELSEKEYTPKGGRLATKWHQLFPYNQYVPFLEGGSGGHSYVGCGAIAAGQYIFFSHKYFGNPATTVDKFTYSATSNSFDFYGNSSSVWNKMDDGSDKSIVSDAERLKPTALFLGYVANGCCSAYNTTIGDSAGTGTYRGDVRNFINKELSSNLQLHAFDILKTIDILKKGYPVFVSSRGDLYKNGKRYNGGHDYLIDYTLYRIVKYYDVFASSVGGSDAGNEDPDNEYGNNLDYYRDKYGSISYRETNTIVEYWLSMNWGGGKYDDVLINASLEEWLLKDSSSELHLFYHEILY